MKLSKACELFLSYSQYTKDLSPLTIKAYKQDLTLLINLSDTAITVDLVTKETIRNCVNYLFAKGQSKSTVKRRLACYKSFFKWLENEEFIEQTPFYRLDLKIKQPLKLPRNLTQDELEKMHRAAKIALGINAYIPQAFPKTTNTNKLSCSLALELLLTTGIRVSELANIRLNDLHLSDRYIHICGKGQRERRVFITNNKINTFIKNYIQFRQQKTPDHTVLLINSLGNPATTQVIRIWIKKLSIEAKTSRTITPHMYRHSAATRLIEAGVDISYVQKLLGHHSITTTQRYTHVNNYELFKSIVKADIQGGIL